VGVKVMPAVVSLATDGRLERWRVALAAGLAAAFSSAEPDLRAWMPSASSEQEDAGRFVSWCVEAFESGRSFAYAIVCGDRDEVAGYVNVTPSDGDVGVLGYWLRPSDRGRGLATAAVCALAGAAFESLGVVEVRADVDARNVASRRVLERAGFVVVGERRRPARTSVQSDVEVVYALRGDGGGFAGP
jgi:RimJ/RimL family protein N-acetyltransferase